ncbi:Crp/Fnr family transcriptional regulator [Kitasatospora sp. NPDC006697]|uniref:Crp/Fnr family transcriptional regulator n=1 Tax=Kitasatospora sp. NPDC006697 TaxID=3364020 RepID=UPI0036B1B8C2
MRRTVRGSAQWNSNAAGGRKNGLSLLGELSESALHELRRVGVQKSYSTGERILVEKEPKDHAVFLLSGLAKVTISLTGSTGEALLAIRVAGDVVGEMAAIENVPRSATVTACSDVDALVVDGGVLRDFLVSHPETALPFIRTVSRRLRKANSWRVDFGEFPARVRLARILSELAEEHGCAGVRSIVIGVKLTQTELAALAGLSLDTAQRALAHLRKERIITTGNRRIEVLDGDRLRVMGLLPAR